MEVDNPPEILKESESSIPQVDQVEVMKERLSLDILRCVKTSQNTYGLRHGDYRRYRQYCTRRLHRIRKTLNFMNGKKRFQKRVPTVTQFAKDPRFMMLTLVQAERAWSHAMELKNAMQVTARTARHATTRMVKAAYWARELEKAARSVADERTSLEAQAYASLMAANASFVREDWKSALQTFMVARRIYEGMANRLDGDDGGLFRQRVEEIDPSIRFCEYNVHGANGTISSIDGVLGSPAGLGKSGPASPSLDLLTAQLESALADRVKSHVEDLATIEWCGSQIPLRSVKVREAVLGAKQEEFALDEEDDADRKTALYDKLFMAYNDASRLVQRELDELRADAAITSEEREKELTYLRGYLSHARLSHTIKRNLLIVRELESHGAGAGESLRLFDTLIHNASEILELPGVNEKTDVHRNASFQIAAFRAGRCRGLAYCYMESQRYREASALFLRSAARFEEVDAQLAKDQLGFDILALIEECRALRCRCVALQSQAASLVSHALQTKLNLDGSSKSASDLYHGLDVFEPRQTLVQIPPPYGSVASKPILFDIASDTIGFPDLAEASKVAPSEEKSQRSGVLGWFSRRR
uniref:Signal recognition particle subunit SRP68 n=1 Tax=Compsopogon caeruleus TaxID=31354 RepID=A0A6T6CZ51_9RHOD|mmetsp:Transcript_9249/g.18838  ORF Transcript_9249/g.18838 Transcript_9249/m.18838 type:complete len:589 (+) Transcript_9249:88-1854(+)|eukprot:CAMPEP_0184681158 /NCGR_PEP_ID=MMETSP0312-20130426/4108_1 /TAXON_ID=31354 /ORGANISM="Compsopogon coeruleus, Strain SAG 36.94" /LENGTH=588 /DNA_ID=CAMNT_0027131801 /DNA_START=44 /DNA_END=1810 /DNA_ORIENTATION=+